MSHGGGGRVHVRAARVQVLTIVGDGAQGLVVCPQQGRQPCDTVQSTARTLRKLVKADRLHRGPQADAIPLLEVLVTNVPAILGADGRRARDPLERSQPTRGIVTTIAASVLEAPHPMLRRSLTGGHRVGVPELSPAAARQHHYHTKRRKLSAVALLDEYFQQAQAIHSPRGDHPT